MRPNSVNPSPAELAPSADFFLKQGGKRPKTLAKALNLTGKKARKLLKAAKRRAAS